MNEETNVDCTNSTIKKEVHHTCCYCGQEAHYQFKNGKWCCSSNQSKCPECKKQIAELAKLRHQKNKEEFGDARFTKQTAGKRIKYPSKGDHVCVYCGGYAKYQLKNGKWCCKPHHNSCPERKKQATNKRNEDGTLKRDYISWRKSLPPDIQEKMNKARNSSKSRTKATRTLRMRYASGQLKGSWNGRKHTEEQITKIRLSIMKHRIDTGTWSKPRVSAKGCTYIDKLNESKGWHLQHGLNGGEVSCDGYFLDGYDKDLNIAFEYDEPAHYIDAETNTLKPRDIKRMNHIHEVLKCRFFRYNEKTDTLYEVSFDSQF